MLGPYMIGLLPDGEAFYTAHHQPMEAQKADALTWLGRNDGLLTVYAVVGNEITDITAAYCKMWVNKADLSPYADEQDFPAVVRAMVPEMVAEVLACRIEDERGQRELVADYHASLL